MTSSIVSSVAGEFLCGTGPESTPTALLIADQPYSRSELTRDGHPATVLPGTGNNILGELSVIGRTSPAAGFFDKPFALE